MHLEQPGGNQQPSLGIFRCVFTQLSLQLHTSPASPNDTETGSTPCCVNTQASRSGPTEGFLKTQGLQTDSEVDSKLKENDIIQNLTWKIYVFFLWMSVISTQQSPQNRTSTVDCWPVLHRLDVRSAGESRWSIRKSNSGQIRTIASRNYNVIGSSMEASHHPDSF